MEERRDLKSMLPFLPLILRSSSLCWPPLALHALKALSLGPTTSNVASGHVLFDAIVDLRLHVGFSRDRLASSARDGYVLYFDKLISSIDSRRWFEEFIPALASLLLRLPSLLEAHYQEEDANSSVPTRLRLLRSQEAGSVFLSQELISALLACSFFCLFPSGKRDDLELPIINFDYLFLALSHHCSVSQENKIKCLLHYFERICSETPLGSVSFERKVLSLNNNPLSGHYPEVNFWVRSGVPVCSLKVLHSGKIEDQQHEALEVDFANKFLGGGALSRGCVQEEIRFMINPELIVGMLFLPCMAKNEAVEIVGAERFSNYTGYASTFLFSGTHLDERAKDAQGRRKTRIIAIDALCTPGLKQYETKWLLREINKAFCGFMDQSRSQKCSSHFRDNAFYAHQSDMNGSGVAFDAKHLIPDKDQNKVTNLHMPIPDMGSVSPRVEMNSDASALSTLTKTCGEKQVASYTQVSGRGDVSHAIEGVGIATGNWGCGAFGGDPEVKCMVQWLAASQALRPFMLYYTFGEPTLERLEEVSQWILSHNWTVGDLWSMLVEYSTQRLHGTHVGFLDWILPASDVKW